MSEHERRPALKYNREMADRYGINPDQPDPPRETVIVDHLPDPPDVEPSPAPRTIREQVNVEESVINLLKQEFGELSKRLEAVGVALSPAMQQECVDFMMALLGGLVGGGAIARRG